MNTHDQAGGDQDGGQHAERDESRRRVPSISSAAGAGRGLDTPHDYDDWKKAVRADPDLPRDLQRAAGDMHRGYADAPEGDMPQKRSDFEEREFAGDSGPAVGPGPDSDEQDS